MGNAQDTVSVQVTERTDSNFVNQLLQSADTSTYLPNTLQYLLKAQNYMEKENDPLVLFDIYTRIGQIYQIENLPNRALPFYQKAERLPSPPVSQRQKVDLMSAIANGYFQVGHIDSALMVYEEQLTFFKTEENYEGVLKNLQNQVNIFLAVKNYRRALDINLRIKTLVEKSGDSKHLAIIFNNIGYNFNYTEEYDKAIDYFLKALETHVTDLTGDNNHNNSELDLVVLYTNIGIAYNNLKDPKNAIEFLLNAQKANSPDNTSGISNAYIQHLIATIYLNHGDVYNALKFNNTGMNNATKNEELRVLSSTYKTAAKIQEQLYDYELALDYYQKHFALRDSFALEDRFRKQQLLQQQLLLEKSEKEIRLLLINQTVQEQAIATLKFQTKFLESESEKLKLNSDKIKLEGDKRQQELALLRNEKEIKDANLRNTELEKQKAQQELVLVQQRLIAEQKDQEARTAKQQEALAQLQIDKSNVEKKEAEQRAELYKKNQDLAQIQLEQEESFRTFVYGLGALMGLLFIMILSGWYYARVANQKLATKNKEIEEERRKSEALLLNILPLETANELKLTGIATPKEYDKVSVLFADFTNFTKISENLSAEELLQELNECFRAFDEITERNGLEKIKTIGDGYMCAGGIPIANETNPADAVRAAIEMQNYMEQRYYEKTKTGISYWNMRIGIHTGHVIAGVVGTKKFAYDIWGDTVNIASRMESTCDHGKINISSKTHGHLNGEFEYTYRGEVEVKHANKVGMYFVRPKG